MKETANFFESIVTEHKKTITEDDPRDYIDAYLDEMKKSKEDPNSSFSKSKGCKD